MILACAQLTKNYLARPSWGWQSSGEAEGDEYHHSLWENEFLKGKRLGVGACYGVTWFRTPLRISRLETKPGNIQRLPSLGHLLFPLLPQSILFHPVAAWLQTTPSLFVSVAPSSEGAGGGGSRTEDSAGPCVPWSSTISFHGFNYSWSPKPAVIIQTPCKNSYLEGNYNFLIKYEHSK